MLLNPTNQTFKPNYFNLDLEGHFETLKWFLFKNSYLGDRSFIADMAKLRPAKHFLRPLKRTPFCKKIP
jgi:hypothetical protein